MLVKIGRSPCGREGDAPPVRPVVYGRPGKGRTMCVVQNMLEAVTGLIPVTPESKNS